MSHRAQRKRDGDEAFLFFYSVFLMNKRVRFRGRFEMRERSRFFPFSSCCIIDLGLRGGFIYTKQTVFVLYKECYALYTCQVLGRFRTIRSYFLWNTNVLTRNTGKASSYTPRRINFFKVTYSWVFEKHGYT